METIDNSGFRYVGSIEKLFSRINPEKVTSMFHHMNGKIDFHYRKDGYYIEFDEYLGCVTGKVDNVSDLFNITVSKRR